MNRLEELIAKLEELFELDKADLDFGIHRIIRQKHKQIKEYLHHRLPETVHEILGELLQNELRNKLKTLRAECEKFFGRNVFGKYDELPEAMQIGLGKEYMETLELYRQLPDGEQLENEVYSHLYEFFSRYYEDADFISLPRHGTRYKYAIPYNGEEVILHWANKDQYYIKSSEDLKDYVFTLEEGDKTLRVKFRLSRMDPVLNNNKAIRAFVPDDEAEIESDENSLMIPFHFKLHDRKPTEKQIIESLCEGLTPKLPEQWRKRLCVQDETYTGKETRTVLEKHLRNYTKKNTSDYFIHKNLGGFLRHELDFYIKNEVMYLDDVDNRSPKYLEGEIRKIKAIRAVAKNLIDFLAQFEDFQKKLWLKKKFVYESQWCMTLDRVPESFYAEIADNENQRREWEKLYSIQDIELQIGNPGHEKGNSLTVEFLKANPFLMVDTAFFSTDFKYRVLAAMENIDEQTDGLLIHSENFQALNLLQERYKEQVQCVYIDPPYNTAASEIIYKNGYKHSCWLTLIVDRIVIANSLMKKNSIGCYAIDDFELSIFLSILSSIFSEANHLATVAIRSNPHGRAMAVGFSSNHEYALFYGKSDESVVGRLPRDEKKLSRYPVTDSNGIFTWLNFRGTGANTRKIDRPKLFYPVFIDNGNGAIRISSMSWDSDEYKWMPLEEPNNKEIVLYPIDNEGNERVWSLGWDRAQLEVKNNDLEARINEGKWQIYRKYRPNQNGMLPGTWWDHAKYSATESGTRVMKNLFGLRDNFSYPKSISLVEDCLRSSNCDSSALILDYFAGSGTTGHAVINLNREDGGNRKYILVEMADYFDTVLKPRIQKVVYSNEWKNGKPASQHRGISHCFKYMRLESYEDTLNNLETEDRHPDTLGIQVPPRVKDEYLIRYMLDMETRSQLCNLRHFEDPFHVSLNIYNRESGHSEPRIMDLPETFNYLLGLRVRKTRMQDGFLVIGGDSPDNEPVLIIWRNVKEKDNTALEIFVKETLQISMADTHYSAVYINGDSTLDDPRGKIRLTEEIFYTLMFDTETAETGDLQWR